MADPIDSIYSERDRKAQEEYYVREGIYNYKFEHINKHLDKFRAEAKFLDKVKWIIAVILAAKYFIDFATDFWVAVTFFKDGEIAYGAAYVTFVLLSVIFMLMSVYEARKIIMSGDISDTWTNNDAKRYYTFTFPYWLMFGKLNKGFKTWDSIALFVYDTLKEWKSLCLVAIPQLIIIIVKFNAVCTASEQPCDVSQCSGANQPACCANPTKVDDSACIPDAGFIVKIVVLGIQMWILGAAISCYPLMRCCGVAATRTNVTFRTYVSITADRVISKYLTEFIKTNDPDLMKQLEDDMEKKRQEQHARTVSGKMEKKVDNIITSVGSSVTSFSDKVNNLVSPTKSTTSPSTPNSPSTAQSPTSPTPSTPLVGHGGDQPSFQESGEGQGGSGGGQGEYQALTIAPASPPPEESLKGKVESKVNNLLGGMMKGFNSSQK